MLIGCSGVENLRALKREFGAKFGSFLINMHAPSRAEAEEYIHIAGG